MNSSEAANTLPKRDDGKKCRYLSAEKKFQVFLEAQYSTEPIGEILRRDSAGFLPGDLIKAIRMVLDEGNG